MVKEYTSAELQDWLFQKATEARSANIARKIILGNDQRGRDTTVIGRLYFFKYDPKWKHKLVKYDKFPMVFPLERYSDGFLGINLHYLSAGDRQVLIDGMLQYKNNTLMDESTRLLLSYKRLMAIANIRSMAQMCVKRYLFRHVKSQFIEILADEYDKAIQLPVEDWVFKQ